VRLRGKAAIVTGAAAGQGQAVAGAFAAEGAEVLLLDVDEDAGEAAAEMIRKDGGTALFRRVDVSSEDDWVGALGVARDRFGRLDVLYNNAALFAGADGPVTELGIEIWDRVFAVNARGVFLGCKHSVPLMADMGGGSIINIASIRAWLGTSRAQDAYAASKGAVVALTRSLAVHLASRQIRANTICPGTILTSMAPLPDEAAVAQRLARYPLGRFGTTDDVIGAAVFLASDEAQWITGTDLVIDGGTSVYYV
jgi:NAD(P)-dependent dehydrogenase (short-subunit alcohol dehydrogenase family)